MVSPNTDPRRLKALKILSEQSRAHCRMFSSFAPPDKLEERKHDIPELRCVR